jgi:hypothetical protein
MEENTLLFNAWINPITFLEVDEHWAISQEEPPDHDAILNFLCAPDIKLDINSLVTRYREISKDTKSIFAAPAEENILVKLIWPLRYAKGCYMLGNYLGTIALCGMVAEMIAILLFEMGDIRINNKPINKKSEINLFGSTFEKLGQDRRVSVLSAYNLISEDIRGNFDIIRNTRRRYLHLFSQDFKQLQHDSKEVFNSTITLVIDIIGQDIHNGKITLKPMVLKYLQKKGLVKPIDKDSKTTD